MMQHVEEGLNQLNLPTFSIATVTLRNSVIRKCQILMTCLKLSPRIQTDLAESFQPVPRVEIDHVVNIKSGDHIETPVTLRPDEIFVIGRSNRAGVHLPDPRISSAHCCLRSDQLGNVTVMDLGSLNGTWLNANRLSPFHSYHLAQERSIQIGPYSIEINKKFQKQVIACNDRDPVRLESLDFIKMTDKTHALLVLKRKTGSELPIYLSRQSLSRLLTWYYGINTTQNEETEIPDFILLEMFSVYCTALSEQLRSRGFGEFTVYSREINNTLHFDRLQVRSKLVFKYFEREYFLDIVTDAESFHKFLEELNLENRDSSRLDRFDKLMNIQISLNCSLKTIRIPLFQWEKLRAGDLVMLGIGASRHEDVGVGKENAFLKIGNGVGEEPGFIGETLFHDHEIGVKINSYCRNGGIMMNRDDNSGGISELATSICETCLTDLKDDSIVSLRIELGETTLSLNEILNLQPGMIVGLKRKITDLFDIKVGTQVLARGHLVRIDDEFGLELIEKVSV